MALLGNLFGQKKQKENFKAVNIPKGPYDIVCPFCFKKFKPDTVVFRAEHSEEGDNEYEKAVDEALNTYNEKIGKASLGELNPIINPTALPKESLSIIDGVIIELKDKYDIATDKRLCPYCHN